MGSTADLRASDSAPVEASGTPTSVPTAPAEGTSPSPMPTASPVATPTASPIATPTASPFDIPSGWRSPGAYPPEDMPRYDGVEVSWGFMSSFEEVIKAADIFIVGEVLAVGPRETSGPMAKSQSQIQVTAMAKGSLPRDSFILVGQIGGIEDQTGRIKDRSGRLAPLPPEAPPGAKPLPPGPSIPPFILFEPTDNPIFRVGERVVLALYWSPLLGMYEGVRGPQGRFRIDAQDRVHPMNPDDPATAALDGLTVEELFMRVEAIATD